MFTRKWAVALIVVLLALPAVSAFGAPYVYVSVLGRTNPLDVFSSVVAVGPGDNIEYQVVANWAEFGTTNSSTGFTPNPPYRTLSSLFYGRSGLTGLTFDLYELGSDQNIQVSLGLPALTSGAWNGLASTPGTVVAGTGTRIGDNVRDIAATAMISLGPPAVVSLNGVSSSGPVPTIVGTGLATVTSLGLDPKADALIKAGVPTSSGTVAQLMYIDATSLTTGKTFNPSKTWVDPVVGYNALTLYQPWAEAFIKDVPAGGFEVDLGTDPLATLTINANAGGSSHTTATYHWMINSGDPLNIDTLVPTLFLDSGQLNALMNEGTNHLITLSVDTGDGMHASGAPIPLTLLPEPATMVLVAVGGLVVAIRRRRAH